MERCARRAVIWVCFPILSGILAGSAIGQERSYKDDFEGPRTRWHQESTDTRLTLRKHDIVEDEAHDGRASERFLISAGPGSTIYVSYPLPKVPLGREPRVSVHLKSAQAGFQLLARVILPADVDPDTNQPSFLTIPGPTYGDVERWQKLEIDDLGRAVEEQARILRLRGGRAVSLQGAYLERLILNLYAGPGDSEVFLDDLALTPAPDDDNKAEAAAPAAEEGPAGPGANAPLFELRRGRLARDGYPWFFRAVEAPGADPRRLRPAAFDIWSFPLDTTDPRLVEPAREAGFLLMPRLAMTDGRGTIDAQALIHKIRDSPYKEQSVFWQIGEELGIDPSLEFRKHERETLREVLRGLREGNSKGAPLATSMLAGDQLLYTQPPYLDLFGVDVPTWGSSRSLIDHFAYLNRHRTLTALNVPQALYWTTVPAAAPPGLLENIWGPFNPPADGQPQVQPEQMRLYSYLAMMAGYRGILLRGDAELTKPAGHARLIEATLLNAEIDLFESILADGTDYTKLLVFPPDPPKIIVYNPLAGGTSTMSYTKKQQSPETPEHPSIRAVAINFAEGNGPRGMLILIADMAAGAQWQPPKMSAPELRIRVPSAARSHRAREITLGGVKPVKSERGVGGEILTLRDFNTTAAILLTGDDDLLARVTAAIEKVRPRAVSMVIEQADTQRRWIRETHTRLANYGKDVRDSAALLKKVDNQIDTATDHLRRGEWTPAWAEARRAEEVLRVLMRDHFDKAMNDLVEATNPGLPPKESRKRPRGLPQILLPISSAPLLSFNTLPEQYIWNDRIRDGSFGRNMLPAGSFDAAKGVRKPEWWSTNLGRRDEIVQGAVLMDIDPKTQNHYLRLRVGLAKDQTVNDQPPFLDQAFAAIRTPPIRVRAGEMFRIGVRLKSEYNLVPGGLGVIVEDSIGGEPLQFRTTGAIPDWQELIFYRQAPADGELSLAIGMAAFGELLVDDISIRPLDGTAADRSEPTPPAANPGLASPDTRRRVR